VDDSRDPFQLQRFIDAQQRAYEVALKELQAGEKRSHWMWFIFPQLAELGRSPTAQFYGIRSLQEARAFLAHPVLGQRYRESVAAMLHWASSKNALEILGDVDAMKLRSSLTLFENASGDPLFAEALEAFFGTPDEATLQLLNRT
jgi:uncharacterized protein (DUF1810 family)